MDEKPIPEVKTFTCPDASCKLPVEYDPDDPMHQGGGMLRKHDGDNAPAFVYLTCANGHTRRYSLIVKPNA